VCISLLCGKGELLRYDQWGDGKQHPTNCRGCELMGWRCELMGWHCELMGWHCELMGWHCELMGWHCELMGWHCELMGWCLLLWRQPAFIDYLMGLGLL
jgi:hypothetical protein